MLGVSERTMYRRMAEFGYSVSGQYTVRSYVFISKCVCSQSFDIEKILQSCNEHKGTYIL